MKNLRCLCHGLPVSGGLWPVNLVGENEGGKVCVCCLFLVWLLLCSPERWQRQRRRRRWQFSQSLQALDRPLRVRALGEVIFDRTAQVGHVIPPHCPFSNVPVGLFQWLMAPVTQLGARHCHQRHRPLAAPQSSCHHANVVFVAFSG